MALQTKSGKVFAAVHLEAYVGRVVVYAEAIAIGMSAAQEGTEIDTRLLEPIEMDELYRLVGCAGS